MKTMMRKFKNMSRLQKQVIVTIFLAIKAYLHVSLYTVHTIQTKGFCTAVAASLFFSLTVGNRESRSQVNMISLYSTAQANHLAYRNKVGEEATGFQRGIVYYGEQNVKLKQFEQNGN